MVPSRGKPNQTKQTNKKNLQINKKQINKKKAKPKPQQTIKPTNKPALGNTNDHGSVLGE